MDGTGSCAFSALAGFTTFAGFAGPSAFPAFALFAGGADLLGFDGFFVLPSEVRRQLGWASGDPLLLECDGDSLLIRREAADEAEAGEP